MTDTVVVGISTTNNVTAASLRTPGSPVSMSCVVTD